MSDTNIINHNINYLDQEEAVLTMFANIVGEPTEENKREFYEYLHDEGEDVGPPVTDENVIEEIERSMRRFVNIKLQDAWTAWKARATAVAGPTCDQCGDTRNGGGGRVCELCDLAAIDPAIVHEHTDTSEYEEAEYDSEEWETPSQEAERRQEMAENMERQMEEYERQCDADDEADGEYYPDLNKAIFEMGTRATADPNIRVGEIVCNDPIMTAREYNAMPIDQAEVFLDMWVKRQADQIAARQHRASLHSEVLREIIKAASKRKQQ